MHRRGLYSTFIAVPLLVLLPLLVGQQCPLAPATQALSADAGSDQTIELGETAVLQAGAVGGSGLYAFQWSATVDGLSSPTSAAPTFTPTEAGTFTITLTVVDSLEATDTDTVTITVTEPGDDGDDGDDGDGDGGALELAVNAGADRVATIGQPVTLNGSVTGGDGNYTIQWTPSANLTGADTLTPVFTPISNATTILTLTVSDGTGAIASDTVEVTATTNTTLSRLVWGSNYSAGGYEVLAEFTAALDSTTATDVQNYRINGTEINPSAATLSSGNTTVRLIFEGQALKRNTQFDISIQGAVLDSDGANVPQSTAIKPVANEADTNNPTLTTRLWSVDYDGSYGVEITFSEAMDETTVENTEAYRITNGSDTQFAASAQLSGDGITMKLVFDGIALATDDALLEVGLNEVLDINGNKFGVIIDQAISANADDTTAPSVVEDSLVFTGNFTGTGTELSLQFDEAMDKESVETVAHYRIHGTSITPSTATLETDGHTATLLFTDGISADDTLDISVSDSIKDINGNAISQLLDQEIAGAASDVTSPTPPALKWLKGDASTGYQFTATFNEPVDETLVEDTDNWEISGSGINPTSVVLSGDGRTATVTFGVPLGRNDTIVVSVDSAIEDLSGNAVAEVVLTVQRNTADTVSPSLAVAPTWAANGDQYQITMTYDEVMDAATVEDTDNFTLMTYNNALLSTVETLEHPTAAEVDATGTVITLTFATTTSGYRTDDGGALETRLLIDSGVRDINGRAHALISAQEVLSNAEVTAPTIVAGGIEWGINKQYTTINVTFSEVMDLTSVETVTNWELGGGAVNPTSVTLSPQGDTAILTFETSAFANTDTLTITNGVLDINGNAFAGAVAQAVATDDATDITPPSLMSAVWSADNAQYRVIATFSEALDTASVGDLTQYTIGATTADSVTVQAGGTELVIAFADAFNRTDVTLEVDGPTDYHGNAVVDSVLVTANPDDTTATAAGAVTAVWAADYADGGYELELVFAGEALDVASAETAGNYRLTRNSASPTDASLSTVDGVTITLDFTTTAIGTTDTIDYSLGSSIMDVNGVPFAQVLAQEITANPADVTAPTATVEHEAESFVVTVTFDEAMDRVTVEEAAWATDSGATLISATLSSDGQTVTLQFDGDAGDGAGGATLTIPGTITDINGVAYAAGDQLIPDD